MLPQMARAAADKVRVPKTPLSRSQALASAPWDESFPPAWERAFRAAYADRLEERGVSLPAVTGRGSSGAGGETKLVECRVYLSKAEQAATKALAKADGVSWSTWARRKLAT